MIAFGEQVTHHVHSDATPDALGNPTSAWLDVPRTAAVWPTVSAESTAGQDIVIRGLTMLFPGNASVSGLDEFTVRGIRYAIDGDPGLYHSPLTGGEVTQVHLLRRT